MPACPDLTVIINGESRLAASMEPEALDAAFRRVGLRPRIERVRGIEVLPAAERAAADGRALVAAGGDGTVSTVASVAVRTGTVFGVLPAGTLNHFARDAGIPMDLEKAVEVLAAGHVRPIDVGEVNGVTFLNNISLGMYPQLVRERTAEQMRGRGKWTAFAIALLRTWRRYPTVTVRMAVDGVPLVAETPFVFIGNGEYKAGGLGLGRRTALNSGHLSIYLAPGLGRFEIVAWPFRALANRLSADPKFEAHTATEAVIDTPAHHVSLGVDGELVALKAPLESRVQPRVLRTIVPEAA
jgi:diacylglycerol kinase family enzyme